MSRPLELETVTRAMLAAASVKTPRRFWTPAEDDVLRAHYGTAGAVARCAALTGRTMAMVVRRAGLLGLRRDPCWTQAEVEALSLAWGEDCERTIRARLPGRTWAGIAQKAKELGLAPPSQGKVSIKEAAARIGLHPVTLRRVLDLAGVRVERYVRGAPHCPKAPRLSRWECVEYDRAVEAVEAYDRRCASTLTRQEAADHCGVSHDTIFRAVAALAATRPVEGFDGRLPRHRWFVRPEDAEAAMVLYRARRASRAT